MQWTLNLRTQKEFFGFFFFWLFRASFAAYGDSKAMGQIGAVTASLHHGHSNVGSKLHLGSTPQLRATPDPWPTEWGQGSNLQPYGYWSDLFPLGHSGNFSPRTHAQPQMKLWNASENTQYFCWSTTLSFHHSHFVSLSLSAKLRTTTVINTWSSHCSRVG